MGLAADVAVRCSHHKAAGRKNWGKVHRTLATIDRARRSGRDGRDRCVPVRGELDRARHDSARGDPPRWPRGHPRAAARPRDRALHGTAAHDRARSRARRRHVGTTSSSPTPAPSATPTSPATGSMRWHGTGGSRPRAPRSRLLVEEELRVQCAFFSMSEDDVATVLTAGFCCIGSDASARAFSGITARGIPHPRTYGTFPRVFGRFVARPAHALDRRGRAAA